MTKDELNIIRARCDAATPGPWITCSCDDDSFWGATVFAEQEGHDDEYIANFSRDQIADAEFIAHARADVPALLAEIDRLDAATQQAANPKQPAPSGGGSGFDDMTDDIPF